MSGMTNVFIKTLSSRNITLAVQYEDSVEILKEKLEAESGIPSKQQRLFYAGKEVDDCQKIMDFRGQRRHVCGVQVHAPQIWTLAFCTRLRAGARRFARFLNLIATARISSRASPCSRSNVVSVRALKRSPSPCVHLHPPSGRHQARGNAQTAATPRLLRSVRIWHA